MTRKEREFLIELKNMAEIVLKSDNWVLENALDHAIANIQDEELFTRLSGQSAKGVRDIVLEHLREDWKCKNPDTSAYIKMGILLQETLEKFTELSLNGAPFTRHNSKRVREYMEKYEKVGGEYNGFEYPSPLFYFFIRDNIKFYRDLENDFVKLQEK